MHSAPLPTQLTGPVAAPAPARKQNAQPEGASQFSQTLSREMGQRSSMPAPAPAMPAKPAPAAKQADKPAQGEDSSKAEANDKGAPAAAAAKTEGSDGSAQASNGKDKDSEKSDPADAATATTGDPRLDLMAIVASFNQVSASVPATPAAAAAIPVDSANTTTTQALPGDLPAAVATPTVLAAAAKAAVQGAPSTDAGKSAPVALDTAFANMMGKADKGMQASLESATAKLATPAASLPAAPVLAPDAPAPADVKAPVVAGAAPAVATAAPAAEGVVAPEPVALKELPVAAPAIAPLQQAATLAPLAAATAVQATDRLSARVGTPAWDNQVAQKIVWMAAGQEHSATLTLNPPDMGPMQVVLSVTNDQASVTFSAAQPEVRQALQDAMPKLRDMMSESGISLGNASVHDGSAGQQQAQGEPARPGQGSGRADTASGSAREAEARVAARPVRGGAAPGLVDTFA
ncbi:MAG: flagellar hook-length control protein FliK [Massilia sp.]